MHRRPIIPNRIPKTSKPKKDLDKLFLEGIGFHGQGNLGDAKSIYEKILSIKSTHFDALHMLGVIAFQVGDLKLSVKLIEKAIAIKSDFTPAHLNHGNSLVELKQYEQAIQSFNKALSINPNMAEAHNSLGSTLHRLGRHSEALGAYEKAIKIKPDYHVAHLNLGASLQKLERYDEALTCYAAAININNNYVETYSNMAGVLQQITFLKQQSHLCRPIELLLKQPNLVRPINIASSIISLLKFEEPVIKALQIQYGDLLNKSLKSSILSLSESTLLMSFMSICPLANSEFENLLKDIRSELLLNIGKYKNCAEILSFQLALALQCFTNEYVYDETLAEKDSLNDLEALIEKTISMGDEPSPNLILCLASYKSLNSYNWSNFLHLPTQCEQLVKRQISEPQIETLLKNQIRVLEDIIDPTSVKVRGQYEQSPYPRWVNVDVYPKPMQISEVVSQLGLKLIDPQIGLINNPTILMGGCGTGQNSIGTASRFQNSTMLAVDLSLSSLAYASRKTQELGIKNIEYLQADILNLCKLNKNFDIVESSGVLHHMDDPMAGWRILVSCLKRGGLMKIGLYSEIARKDIVKIRGEIAQSGIGSSDDEIKSFRRQIIHSSERHHKQVQSFGDFYNLSSFRDLLFHVQEHRFTLLQINDCLASLGLVFCGFEAVDIVKQFKAVHTNPEDLYDLEKWHLYEEKNPYSFAGMYQFWCQKL